ncbi:hypothetical protein SDC9_166652 [bioreactor metagenome]|uniref:Uncharacterized protein n=1 Tax=bioreactor metagenome TaxID=1076179 RepID=A0A645FXW3_9ZZZZ
MDDEEELPPSRIRLPRTPAEIPRNPAEEDDDDSITFRMPAPPNPRSMEHLSDMRRFTEALTRMAQELRSNADGAPGRLLPRD